ncbi:hypothetical protein F5J12DRAFT_780592 [Pisolithus orientalis]|uniref:uncharacterized protein n=1 Tax=Pisolithus orientalis TaxID=936130 RepID=UPI002224AC7D|nr:uncharacterized protein F5J12DRAFT_780592 [Pisolithus orientalis]KAI6025791.1 hypothetical protein F5J12DRAFT_780592 [Pisolithus orientalis]
MSSTHQVSPHKSNDPSSLQRATTPELQITSNDEEANIQAKMAKCKQHKAVREEAAQLEAERLEREQLEAEQHEREWVEAEKWEQEWLEAERKEQEQLEAKHWEQEAQVQLKTGELKGEAWEKGTGSCKQCKKGQVPCTFSHMQQSKCKKRTCNQCTEMKVRCKLPEGVEPEAKEAGVKSGSGKKQAPEDATLLRAGEKRKVTQTVSGVPAVVVKGFKLIVAAMDQQTVEMQARRETQHWFNSWLGDLLDCKGVGMELDKGIMHWPKDMCMKGWWSSLESGEEQELWMSKGEVFKGDSK